MAELAAKERRVLRLLAGVCALWAVFQLTRGSFNFLAPVPFGLTFNSMAAHLLAGRFDVDPAAVGAEGFARDGRIYAYFGIFCALLRLPWLAAGGAGVDARGVGVATLHAITTNQRWMNQPRMRRRSAGAAAARRRALRRRGVRTRRQRRWTRETTAKRPRRLAAESSRDRAREERPME